MGSSRGSKEFQWLRRNPAAHFYVYFPSGASACQSAERIRSSGGENGSFGIQLSGRNPADASPPAIVAAATAAGWYFASLARMDSSFSPSSGIERYLFPGLRNLNCAGITPPLEDLNKISRWAKATDVVHLNLSSFVREFAVQTPALVCYCLRLHMCQLFLEDERARYAVLRVPHINVCKMYQLFIWYIYLYWSFKIFSILILTVVFD